MAWLVGSKMTQEYLSLEDLLRFYEISGVETALAQQPINRFEAAPSVETNAASASYISFQPQSDTPIKREIAAPEPKTQPVQETVFAPAPPIKPPLDIGVAQSLDQLCQMVENIENFPLRFTAKNTCFGDGKPHSQLMIIGSAPGREEDLSGKPFMGKTGQLLTTMLEAIGLGRHDVYLTNTIAWRPPGNRKPTAHEIETYRPYLQKQIALVKPKFILTLGEAAFQALTGQKISILRARGKWQSYNIGDVAIDLLPTLDPAYLTTPNIKKTAWHDLLSLKQKLPPSNAQPSSL